MASTINVSGVFVFTVAASNAIYNEVTCNLAAIKMSAYNVQEQAVVFSFLRVDGDSKTALTAHPTLTVYNKSGAALLEQKPAAAASISYTIPVTGLATADRVMVRIYSDAARTKLLAESAAISVVRENPMPFPRGESWTAAMVFKNGEMLLLDNVAYMWSSPVSGNSALHPKTDIATNAATTYWVAYQNWPLLCTNLLMANMALIAGAVHKDGKLFSQKGTVNGVISSDYRDPIFIPNLLLNFINGDAVLAGKIEAKENSKIGGFNITGYGLSNSDNKDSFIYIKTVNDRTHTEYTGQGAIVETKYKEIRSGYLGNKFPGQAGFDAASSFEATGMQENRAITAVSTGSKVQHNITGGFANLAVDAVGGVNWEPAIGDHWRMPGVLCAADIRGNPVGMQNKWGNGATITGVTRNSDKSFTINHDLNHEYYYVLAIPSSSNSDGSIHEIMVQVFNKGTKSITLYFKTGRGDMIIPAAFSILVFGMPSK